MAQRASVFSGHAPPPSLTQSHTPCEQAGADPWKVIRQMREKLRLNAAAVQLPIGSEDSLRVRIAVGLPAAAAPWHCVLAWLACWPRM